MFKRILVPLDGSKLAEGVLPHVRELAKIHGAELLLLRVAFSHPLPGMDPIKAQTEVVEEALSYLADLEKELKREGLRVSSAVRYGRAAEEILDHAKDNQVDIIAMSTHGRSGISRLVLGSVSEDVLRCASVPVLLVRSHTA